MTSKEVLVALIGEDEALIKASSMAALSKCGDDDKEFAKKIADKNCDEPKVIAARAFLEGLDPMDTLFAMTQLILPREQREKIERDVMKAHTEKEHTVEDSISEIKTVGEA